MRLNSIAIPLSVIFAALIIAGAVIYKSSAPSQNSNEERLQSRQQEIQNTKQERQATGAESIPSVTREDHILGNPNAAVKVITYTDPECPSCKKFHTTMQKIMQEYGKSGKMAWIIRLFPIEQLHPQALQKTQALECAAKIGADGKFWSFLNKFFDEVPQRGSMSISQLPKIAEDINIDQQQFRKCIEGDSQKALLRENLKEGKNAGIRGTPTSFVVSENNRAKIRGARSYEYVKQKIENALNRK